MIHLASVPAEYLSLFQTFLHKPVIFAYYLLTSKGNTVKQCTLLGAGVLTQLCSLFRRLQIASTGFNWTGHSLHRNLQPAARVTFSQLGNCIILLFSAQMISAQPHSWTPTFLYCLGQKFPNILPIF